MKASSKKVRVLAGNRHTTAAPMTHMGMARHSDMNGAGKKASKGSMAGMPKSPKSMM